MKNSLAITAALLCSAANVCGGNIAKKPNIIFILTDDQGYGDLGCMGNPYIHTPNIDNLERESFSFSDFHSGTTSAPTRAGIMTGKYCNSTGVWHTINGRSLLSLDDQTLPQILNENGYETAMFGKWHLGDNYPYRPHDRGFKEALYHGGGGVGQTPDAWENNYFDDTYFRNGVKEKTSGYCTDVWFEEAISFIDKNKENPFFCYISTNAPHGPFNVEKKYADLYAGNPNVPNPNFYGMITNIDENVGKLMDYLSSRKLLDNTIVIYMTDNGTGGGAQFDEEGNLVKGFNAYMSGKKGSRYEGGHRVPFIMRVPGRVPRKIYSLSCHIDILPTFLELCGLEEKIPSGIDGQSLLSLMEKDEESERYVFADNQRKEYLKKGRSNCVMYKKWRLLNGQNLYNVLSDPLQRVDLAERYPEMVKKMKEQYDLWWERSSMKRAEKFEAIPVGDINEPYVLLYCHDLHNDKSGHPAWNQTLVRAAGDNSGYWALDVKKTGKYRVSLYRWTPDANLKLNEAAPAKEETWGNVVEYNEGVAIRDFESVEVLLNHELVQKKKVNDKKMCVEVTMNLKEGPCFLQADFIRKTGKRLSAYYVTVEPIK
ncbi:arylsulfatase [Bacteroides sp.]|uniref:arylsulfatase n=1 Tax=Bacteroides sp. TaxID=29523 RepID=UPI0025C202E5|nr:arylsulfatase [Bacteroides sp.]